LECPLCTSSEMGPCKLKTDSQIRPRRVERRGRCPIRGEQRGKFYVGPKYGFSSVFKNIDRVEMGNGEGGPRREGARALEVGGKGWTTRIIKTPTVAES